MECGNAEIFYVEDASGEVKAFLGAVYLPGLWRRWPTANAQFIYLDPTLRKGSTFVRLFDVFMAEGERRGARQYFAGHKVGINEPAMKAFLERRGFVPGETLFWKNI